MEYPRLKKTMAHIVARHEPLNGWTRLLQMVFLADRLWFQKYGSQYTEARFHYWNLGPYSVEALKAYTWLDGIELVDSNGVFTTGHSSRLGPVELDPEFVAVLNDIGQRWATARADDLRDYVYSLENLSKFGAPLLRN